MYMKGINNLFLAKTIIEHSIITDANKQITELN